MDSRRKQQQRRRRMARKAFVQQVEVDDGPFDHGGLSIRQQQFVAAIVGPAQGNATKAAQLAGYRSDNRVALASTAYENLRKPQIQEAIAHALAAKRATAEWAKASLVDLASSSMHNFLSVDARGNASIDFKKAAAAGALGQIKEYREEGVDTGNGKVRIIKRTIKLHDPTAALITLLKLHRLLKDGKEVLPSPPPANARQFDMSWLREFGRTPPTTSNGP
jgi:hypothetical protein